MDIAKRSVLTVLALLTAVLVAIGATMSMAVALAATVLLVPGTGVPDATKVDNYIAHALDYYVAPYTPSCSSTSTDCTVKPIDYPAQFWPIPLAGWGGLSGAKWDVSTGKGLATLESTLDGTLHPTPPGTPNTPIVIFGYSQGGNIVSREKRNLGDLGANPDAISFVMIGNTNRPNGGLFERLALLGHVPILDATFGLPAPTNTCDQRCATDIAFEYDGVSDFPLYPLNALATLNALAGFWYVHGSYLAPNGRTGPNELPDGYTEAELKAELDNQANWSDYGDTRYITIPTKTLPLVRPFLEFGGFTHTSFIVKPIVDLLEPVLRVLIDTGYDRTLSPGVPAPFRLIPLNINPVKLTGDVVKALGEGVKAALADIGIKAPPKPAPVTSTNLAAANATSNNLATAKKDAQQSPKTLVDNKTEATDPGDNKKTESPEATDTKTEPPNTPVTPRPKVRGPIGSGPLAQLVRQFHDTVTGKHGTTSGTTKTGTDAQTQPVTKPDTTPESKPETPSTTAESSTPPAAKDSSSTAATAA